MPSPLISRNPRVRRRSNVGPWNGATQSLGRYGAVGLPTASTSLVSVRPNGPGSATMASVEYGRSGSPVPSAALATSCPFWMSEVTRSAIPSPLTSSNAQVSLITSPFVLLGSACQRAMPHPFEPPTSNVIGDAKRSVPSAMCTPAVLIRTLTSREPVMSPAATTDVCWPSVGSRGGEE